MTDRTHPDSGEILDPGTMPGLQAEIERLRAELDALKTQPPAILPEEAFDIGLEAIPYYTAHSF